MNSAEPTHPVGGGASDVAPSRPGSFEGAGRLRTVVLGVELWALATAIPLVEHPSFALRTIVLGGLPLLLLALGELARARSTRASRVVLLAGVPVSIALSAAAQPELAATDAWWGVLGPLVAFSALAYLAVTLHSFARPAPTRATGWQPVPEAAWSRAPSGRSIATIVVGLVLGLGLLATGVLPFASARATIETRFPGASDDARTLAIAVGGGLFSVALGAIVGPALRARRGHDGARERIGRSVVISLVIAVAAAIGWAWLTFGTG